MLRLLRNRTGQHTIEYAILIAVVIGALSAMQLYMKRGIQARLKDGTDNIAGIVETQASADLAGASNLFGTDTQYEPYYMAQGSSNMTTNATSGTEKGIVSQEGGKRDLSDATTSRTGTQTMAGGTAD